MPTKTITLFSGVGQPDPLAEICIQSFLHHGHKIQVFSYEALTGEPAGLIVRDAREILDSEEAEVWVPYPEMLTTIFKYKFLLKEGGLIMDPCFFCLSDEFPENDLYGVRGEEGAFSLALLGLPAGHEIAKMLVHFGEDPRLCTPFRDAYFVKRLELSQRGIYWDDAVPLMDSKMIGEDFLQSVLRHCSCEDMMINERKVFPLLGGTWSLLFEFEGIDLSHPMFEKCWAVHCSPEVMKLHSEEDLSQKKGIVPQLAKKMGIDFSSLSTSNRRNNDA